MVVSSTRSSYVTMIRKVMKYVNKKSKWKNLIREKITDRLMIHRANSSKNRWKFHFECRSTRFSSSLSTSSVYHWFQAKDWQSKGQTVHGTENYTMNHQNFSFSSFSSSRSHFFLWTKSDEVSVFIVFFVDWTFLLIIWWTFRKNTTKREQLNVCVVASFHSTRESEERE